MVPDLEKPRVTELHVRMDCNGCVHKIKKAVTNIEGVYGVYIDFAQQKLTVVGRYDPEKVVKAIKKTRKVATICSHTEPGEPAASEQQPLPEPAASGEQPVADAATQPPPSEAPAAPQAEPPKDAPPPIQDIPAPEVEPSQDAKTASLPPPMEINVGEVPMMHHYPHSYYPVVGNDQIRYESPYYVTHGYNNHISSPYQTGYRYRYIQSPPRDIRYNGGNRGPVEGQQITSIFSDENPNSCSIV